MKNFVVRLLDTYRIGPDDVQVSDVIIRHHNSLYREFQVSMMKYNKHVYDLWDYDVYQSKTQLFQVCLHHL